MNSRRQIQVSGVVQGVGFRPYVFRLASMRSLAGNVRNTSQGVTIEIEGSSDAMDEFIDRLPKDVPPLACITGIHVHELPCNGERSFRIVESVSQDRVRTLISPDVALCEDCLRELFDPANRRYRYPFINCTNCGPRFTIVQRIPYDRPFTSMAGFTMCPECLAEYNDPLNRRFHAQPNGCWKCGPQLELWNPDGAKISCSDPVAEVISRLRQGEIVAVKGLGGFHLAVDAMNPGAVERLRARKSRYEKPFAVMVPDLASARTFCDVDEPALLALQDRPRPIVLIPKRVGCGIAEQVAPSHTELGLFLPYTPLHHLLFESGSLPALVMTSANRSEEPIVIGNHEAVERLRGLADCLLVHDREILWRCDDSVVRAHPGGVRQIRRSRGHVPAPILLASDVPPVLGVGGELKNTICLAKGREAFLSQHIGDLENLESWSFFQDVISHFERILEIKPEAIAYDLHPEYLSTKWALQQQGIRLFGVQHHHAHIASCMAENGLSGNVLGLALDGTGYGTDGTIWGGEALLADYSEFKRVGHFTNVPMPGGDQAIREPWRMAVAYLSQLFGREFLNFPVPFVRNLDHQKTETLLRMMDRGVNSPLTSSAGRLFDAVAALIGLQQKVTYEGQAAVALEMAMAHDSGAGAYDFALRAVDDVWIIETLSLFDSILADLKRQTPPSIISLRFHRGLVAVLARLAAALRDQIGLSRICLSGGTFQNSFLLENLTVSLQSRGFQVFTQTKVPSGDGGLSLGQVLVAAHKRM
jgi:hydrogenase maturation protein HypF